MRHLVPNHLKQMKAEFETMLELGVIVIEKPVGIPDVHPCTSSTIDHRALNAHTMPGRYSPPHIEDFVQQLHGK